MCVLYRQLESLFIEVIYTIRHKVGAVKPSQPSTAGSNDLTDHLTRYSQLAFPLDASTHARLMQAVREEKVRTQQANLVN